MKEAIVLVLVTSAFAFHSPYDRSVSLPYGRQLRATLSGKIPTRNTSDEDLSWWESIDRNNTIECKCGQFTTVTDPSLLKPWESEGVKVLHEYPWSVSLVSAGEGPTYAFCGGTLISDRFVLTSAVCADGFQDGDLDVLIGTWPKGHLEEKNVTDDSIHLDGLNLVQLIRKQVHRVIVHPKYSSNVLDYNIALLRLKGPVPTYGNNEGVGPVCLPEVDEIYNDLESSSLLWRFYNGESFCLDGYIIPEKRSEVNSKVLSKEDCRGYNYNREWALMPDTMMCAKMEIPSNLKDHPYYDSYDCPGDAGGGLFTTINGKKVQVGIDSWTACYGRPRGVGVFTRVQEFLKWIRVHISEDGRLCSA